MPAPWRRLTKCAPFLPLSSREARDRGEDVEVDGRWTMEVVSLGFGNVYASKDSFLFLFLILFYLILFLLAST